MTFATHFVYIGTDSDDGYTSIEHMRSRATGSRRINVFGLGLTDDTRSLVAVTYGHAVRQNAHVETSASQCRLRAAIHFTREQLT